MSQPIRRILRPRTRLPEHTRQRPDPPAECMDTGCLEKPGWSSVAPAVVLPRDLSSDRVHHEPVSTHGHACRFRQRGGRAMDRSRLTVWRIQAIAALVALSLAAPAMAIAAPPPNDDPPGVTID